MNSLNISSEHEILDDCFIEDIYYRKRIKTRSESSEDVFRISGSNTDGSASVYVKPAVSSVDGSSYQLGLMDVFVAYQHRGGHASKSGEMVYFTAYGEGAVKLIWNEIELYIFNVTKKDIVLAMGNQVY